MSRTTKHSTQKKLLESLVIFLFGGAVQLTACRYCWTHLEAAILIGSYAGFLWAFLSQGSAYLVDLLDRWVDWLKYPIRRLIVSAAGVCALVLLVTASLNAIYEYIIEWVGAFSYSLADFRTVLLITLAINIFMHGRAFLLNWRQAAIDIERMRNEQLSSQYESLKNQVNPHFLFNSLNALSSLVYDDQRKAVEFIRKLSEVYRYVLDQKDQEVVQVKEEIDFVRSYVFLHQIRFGENLQVNYQGDLPKGYVPPLAVQMLIENAIKHNVVSESKPLTIEVVFGEKEIIVSNIIRRKVTRHSTGLGLQNLKARYKYLSDEPMEIRDDDKDFKVTLPILDLK